VLVLETDPTFLSLREAVRREYILGVDEGMNETIICFSFELCYTRVGHVKIAVFAGVSLGWNFLEKQQGSLELL